MRHLKYHNNYQSTRSVIAYDFDGTLHLSVNKYGHPLNYYAPIETLVPNWPTINQLKEDSKTCDIYVVSARNTGDEKYIKSYCDLHNLDVKGVYCTDDTSKLYTLQMLRAIRIYDDNLRVKRSLTGSNIEFRLPLYESSQQ